ncbi:hypothetical protein OE903_10680 [Bacillus sp. B6(2022)]|nr:hypothetical protein [Bacillus sp. B6(2022)]
MYEHQGQTLFILLNTRKVEDWKERAEKAANDITQLYDREKPGEAVINYGIGSYCEQFQYMRKSFQAAKEVLHLKKVMPQRIKSPFYQDLHMLRLMPVMKESGLLECMVKEYLEPVILYDKQNSGRLYQTLNIFLQTNGSKKKPQASSIL